MGTRNEMRRDIFTLLGTPFEELEEGDAASKRPLAIENQIVTDEKGRRRFHGAFTGGFSAGYFNTVGTKEGWAPSTFKSTRSKREDQQGRRPEDFMDSDDLGEYGIAPRRIRTTQQFRETVDSAVSQKRRFAGESTTELEAVTDRLSDLIKPVSDSIGVILMRSMGWRPGKGVGAEETAISRNRREGTSKLYGCEMPPGAEVMGESPAVVELDAMAPGFKFAPSDVDFITFEPKTDLHGLGYKGLDVERFLKPSKSLEKPTSLKTSAAQAKGIKGQAFGVGAFEDDDEDVYASEDISRYDFALGGSDAHQKRAVVSNEFVPASSSQPSRKFFPAPKLSRNFTPSLPPALKKAAKTETCDQPVAASETDGRSKNAVHRASVLGETHSVWSLVSEKDRQRIEAIKTGTTEVARGEKSVVTVEKTVVKVEKTIQKAEAPPFPDDPKKRARYQDFVSYLKRGLFPCQPPDMTEWDWEIEQTEFRKLIPSDLVSVEIDARARQRPLAGDKLAAAFSGGFKSKFTQGDFAEESEGGSGQAQEDEDKVKAVQMKMFGAMTREKHEWHPDRNLCKRFNVPHPYPDSRVVGIPYLKKDTRSGLLPFNFDSITPSASNEEKQSVTAGADQSDLSEPDQRSKTVVKEEIMEPDTVAASSGSLDTVTEEPRRPPMSLFKAIFAETSSSSESDDDDEAKGSQSKQDGTSVQAVSTTPSVQQEKKLEQLQATSVELGSPLLAAEEATSSFVEVTIEDDDDTPTNDRRVERGCYGPALPPEACSTSLPVTSVIQRHKHKKESHRHHSERKHKKKKSHKEKHHKLKDKKRKKRVSKSATGSESSDDHV